MLSIHWKRIKKFSTPSIIYIGVNLFSQLLSFVLFVAWTRLLTPVQFGILATFQAFLPLGENIIDQGSTAFLSREYFDIKKSEFSLGDYIFHSLLVKIFFSVLFFLLLWVFLAPLKQTYQFPTWVIFFLPLLCFMMAVSNMVSRLWIVQEKTLLYGEFIIFRGGLGYGALGAAQATLLAFGVKTIISFIIIQKISPLPWLRFSQKIDVGKSMEVNAKDW